MPVLSGVDIVIAVRGRACADVDLDVAAVGGRAGGGAVVDVSAVGGRAGSSAGDGVNVEVSAVIRRAGDSADDGVNVEVSSVGGRADGGVTAVGGSAGVAVISDVDVTAVGGRAGGCVGAAVSSDVSVVVSCTAIVVEVDVVGCAPMEQRHGSTGYSRRGKCRWGGRLPGHQLLAAEGEGGRLGSRLFASRT